MKALVLSGGAGTRLRPLTHTSAKQLVPVANKPILDYGLEAIAECGITDVGIIVGDTRDAIREHAGDGRRYGIDLTYIHQSAPLGLAHAVLAATEFLADDNFVMYLGDNLVAGGITAFVEQFHAHPCDAQILLAKVPDPQRFGVAELDDEGRVTRLVEKPKVPKSEYALVGVYLFSSRIHDAARSIKPSWRGELEITDAIQWLIDGDATVRSRVIEGWWKDTGKVEDLLEANRIVLDVIGSDLRGTVDVGSVTQGRVVLEEGAELVRSFVRGPAIIGTRTRLVESFIGPYTSVAEECLIEDSEIQHSVIMGRTNINGVRSIQDSLIGRDVTVGIDFTKPRAYRLTLGDHSHVRFS